MSRRANVTNLSRLIVDSKIKIFCIQVTFLMLFLPDCIDTVYLIITRTV